MSFYNGFYKNFYIIMDMSLDLNGLIGENHVF
jgi:hypothetical protein